MNLELTDKVAIVTGSSRGLGLAAARALAAEGCSVVISGRGADDLAAALEDVQRAAASSSGIVAVQTDLTAPGGIETVFDRTIKAYGRIDVLVNNLGVAGGAGLLDTTDQEWQSAFDQTLYPAIRASRLAVPHMRAQGGGVILMIASIYGRKSGGRNKNHAVKAAEISLGKSLAQQLARDNIRVNSIAPGSILFPGGSWYRRRQADPEGIAEFVRRELPFGRFGRPDEIGAVVAFLASARASWISGACVPVDGCQSRSRI